MRRLQAITNKRTRFTLAIRAAACGKRATVAATKKSSNQSIKIMKPTTNKYNQLLDNIGITLQKAREHAIKAINTELVKAN
jgi:hypothetical protein